MGKRRRSAVGKVAVGPKIQSGTKPDIDRLVREYRRLWKKKYGEEYTDRITRSAENKAKELVKLHGLRKLMSRLPVFFSDADKWLGDHQHPLGYFLNRVNRYGNGKAKKGTGRFAPRED